MKGKKVIVECAFCLHLFEKSLVEFNRSCKAGNRHLCSRSCAGKLHNREYVSDAHHLLGYVRSPDTESPFRWFMKVINQRRGKLGETDIDIEYLKQTWDKQKGLCPYTGWALSLPIRCDKWDDVLHSRRASLDRIDNSLGYTKGNVQFVSSMANMAKNQFKDDELIEFCKAVAAHRL